MSLVKGYRAPHIIHRAPWIVHFLYGVGQEAEKGTQPQKSRESTKQLKKEFDYLRSLLWWSEGIRPISDQYLCCLFT